MGPLPQEALGGAEGHAGHIHAPYLRGRQRRRAHRIHLHIQGDHKRRAPEVRGPSDRQEGKGGAGGHGAGLPSLRRVRRPGQPASRPQHLRRPGIRHLRQGRPPGEGGGRVGLQGQGQGHADREGHNPAGRGRGGRRRGRMVLHEAMAWGSFRGSRGQDRPRTSAGRRGSGHGRRGRRSPFPPPWTPRRA